ncbi:uncharacterized protein LOC129773326 [Toxorhynchites rutilus septentrionalis]|uniref:uncharacterized protein LOC129773326 n=1 Tax=Toxorhynchites rutilus septentrionalis TaxID=329112 RepID=UPI00247A09C7|nr:uncharacterized protein LOC129773326 [Toxorhynchites rutilus septentrionalis]
MAIIPVEAIEIFSVNSADWNVYRRRLCSIFTNYGVTDTKKMASYFFMKLDQETFRLLNNLSYPKEITTKSYDDIVKILDQLYVRKVSVFAERVKFYEVHQMEGEKVNEYHCRIRGAAATCEFGNNLLFAIRDKFITRLRKSLLSLDSRDKNPIVRAVKLKGHNLQFELDTGSPASCISMELYKKVFGHHELNPTDLTLFGYTGEKIKPDGKLQVQMQVEGITMNLEIYVMTGGGPPLLGRDYVRKANLLLNMNTDGDLNKILKKYSELFNDIPGCYRYGKVELRLKSNVCPVFRRPRQVAHSLKEKVDAQLDFLEKNGTITRITTRDWGTPLVPILCEFVGIIRSPLIDSSRIASIQFPELTSCYPSYKAGTNFRKLIYAMPITN